MRMLQPKDQTTDTAYTRFHPVSVIRKLMPKAETRNSLNILRKYRRGERDSVEN